MGEKNYFVVDSLTGEIIWVNIFEKNILCGYNYIYYDIMKRIWLFRESKRKDIEDVLKYERIVVN